MEAELFPLQVNDENGADCAHPIIEMDKKNPGRLCDRGSMAGS